MKTLNISINEKDTGTVLSINNGIVKVSGLPNCKMGEIVFFNNKIKGKVIKIAETITILSFGDVNIGDIVTSNGEEFYIEVGKNQKILNGLGEGDYIDGEIYKTKKIDLMEIAPITEMIFTGTLSVDLNTPIGFGQKILIFGDGKTGKSTFCLNTILNNKQDPKNFFIYVSISQSKNFNEKLKEFFKDIPNSLLIIAEASDSLASRYYAPNVGMSYGEYFRDIGLNVFLFLDDLTKHAMSFRTMYLLAEKNVGREAYPGEIFTEHSNLLERAGKKIKSGSITCFGVVSSNDISNYIPTNFISIVDGQIVFDIKQKRLPYINIELSVTRIGGLLPDILKQNFLSTLKRYKQYVGISETSEYMDNLIKEGELLEKLFDQKYKIYSKWETYLIVILLKKYNKERIFAYLEFFKYFPEENIIDFSQLERTAKYIDIMDKIKNDL